MPPILNLIKKEGLIPFLFNLFVEPVPEYYFISSADGKND
jgi:hypothetical protein